MKVTIKVYDVYDACVVDGKDSFAEREELRFTLVLPVSSDLEAGDLAEFANGRFSLANCQHPSDWYAGLRMAYMGLKSAYHFDGDCIRINTEITG